MCGCERKDDIKILEETVLKIIKKLKENHLSFYNEHKSYVVDYVYKIMLKDCNANIDECIQKAKLKLSKFKIEWIDMDNYNSFGESILRDFDARGFDVISIVPSKKTWCYGWGDERVRGVTITMIRKRENNYAKRDA